LRSTARTGLVVRKSLERQAARRRIASNTRRPPTVAQLAFDPLSRPGDTRKRRSTRFWLGIAVSLVAHGAAVIVGLSLRTSRPSGGDRRQEVKIEVRQRPPEPPPKKEPEPLPVEKPARVPPQIAKTPVKAPPPSAPPPPPSKIPPVRVVGLSLESTTEGGEGPAFAVGNTRFGETATRAVAPKDVSPAPPGLDPMAVEARGPGQANRVASRIPVAGVKYELPKRRHPHEPPYPATLKSQGIEDDVTVLVAIDVTGKVTSVKLIKASQYPELNESARVAALAEEWDPATKDEVPMPYSVSFKYRFRLQDQ